ncbi:MAG: hypothetical protein WBZ04_03395 [Candidatus Nanopelagicales bacterium]
MIGRVISAFAVTSVCFAALAVPAAAQSQPSPAPAAPAEITQNIGHPVEQFEMHTIGPQRGHVALVGSAPVPFDWAIRATNVRVFVDGHRVNARACMKYGGETIIETAFRQCPGTYTVVVELVMKESHKKVAVSHPVVVTVTGS